MLNVENNYTEISDSFKLELIRKKYFEADTILYLKFSIENISDMND